MRQQSNRNVAAACLLYRAGEYLRERIRDWDFELRIETDSEIADMVKRLTAAHAVMKAMLRSVRSLEASRPWGEGLLGGLLDLTKALETLLIEPWKAATPARARTLAQRWKKKGRNPLARVKKRLEQWQNTLRQAWLEAAHETCRTCIPPTVPSKSIHFFIASSAEGLDVAKAMRKALKAARPGWKFTLWNDPHVFPPGESTLETLEAVIAACHFGLYLFTADDKLVIRGERTVTARGNVILEFGMGIGFHNRRRSFLIHARSIHIPSDLRGITTVSFIQPKPSKPTKSGVLAKSKNPKPPKSPPPTGAECKRVAASIVAAVEGERRKTLKEWSGS